MGNRIDELSDALGDVQRVRHGFRAHLVPITYRKPSPTEDVYVGFGVSFNRRAQNRSFGGRTWNTLLLHVWEWDCGVTWSMPETVLIREVSGHAEPNVASHTHAGALVGAANKLLISK